MQPFDLALMLAERGYSWAREGDKLRHRVTPVGSVRHTRVNGGSDLHACYLIDRITVIERARRSVDVGTGYAILFVGSKFRSWSATPPGQGQMHTINDNDRGR